MRFLLSIIFFCILHAGAAQANPAYDSAAVAPRSFNGNAIEVYRQDQQFQYDKIKEPTLSLWQRFWRWFWDKVEDVMSNPTGRATVNTILIVLGIAAIVFFILKLVGDRSTLFAGKGSKGLDYKLGEEDIHSISFEEAISEALANENYRLAVRLVYLHSLKLLSDKDLIVWKAGKTNTNYLEELKMHPSYRSFLSLTTEFEYAWYGGESVSREHYQDIDAAFSDFKNNISQ